MQLISSVKANMATDVKESERMSDEEVIGRTSFREPRHLLLSGLMTSVSLSRNLYIAHCRARNDRHVAYLASIRPFTASIPTRTDQVAGRATHPHERVSHHGGTK